MIDIQNMQLLKSYNLQASSMLESVIAIAIISVCLVIATMVYVKVIDTDYDMAYYMAQQEVSKLHYQTLKDQSFEDETFDYEVFKINKATEDINPELKRVTFNVDYKIKQTYAFVVKVVAVE